MINNIIPFYKSTNKVIVESKDCYQYDSDGKVYIDFESGVWCTNIGHCNDRITKIIADYSKKNFHHGYKFRNIESERLSVELLSISEMDKGSSVFLSSGSEAVNLAITIAQNITKRKKILKINNSYLSAYGFGKISPDNNYVENIILNDIKSIDKINFNEISALVLEVGGASIDVVQFPEYNFIQKLVDRTKHNGCIVIAEEVTTGIGRTGRWFGYQHYDIIPDILVAGKGLGNGYPISTVVISSVIEALLLKDLFIYAQSHQNDPLGCAIALEIIKYINENNLIEYCAEIGVYFEQQLKSLQEKYPEKIKDIRGKGLMLAIEFTEVVDGNRINEQLFDAGFIVGYKLNKIRLMPPFTIKQSDIDKLILTLGNFLNI